MTLIVSARPNAGYNGRFKAKAQQLVKSGTRVGMVWLSKDDSTWHCHVCKTDNRKPEFEADQKDHWGECPNCHTPFVMAYV
jgi:hypothetical protein